MWSGELSNTPKSQEFVINSRGNKVHIRSHWPTALPCKAIAVYLHGYASHGNRPTQNQLKTDVAGYGIGFVTLDFSGHGYSEGTRALINSHEDLIDDALCVLKALYSKVAFFSVGDGTQVSRFAPPVPFFLIGHSMGGAVSILLGNIFDSIKNKTISESRLDLAVSGAQENKHPLELMSSFFSGCILLAPAIQSNSAPNPVVRAVLDWIAAPFFGTTPMPEGLTTKLSPSLIWTEENYVKYVEQDEFPSNIHGLTWGGPILFQTASTLLHLMESVQAELSAVSYPFVVLHDPADIITPIIGSTTLISLSSTPADKKELVVVEGANHDPLANKYVFTSQRICEYISTRLA